MFPDNEISDRKTIVVLILLTIIMVSILSLINHFFGFINCVLVALGFTLRFLLKELKEEKCQQKPALFR